ncbi:MAG TPA: 2-oxo acid dehydrogenase subunit E2 [Planctomycetota bacterium]|nr:2-oxo acid dehydrogenase subunit E2 [Planctomycetota bacterium]
MPTTFHADRSPSTFRKIAAAMWNAPNDPTIYGSIDVDATPILAAVEKVRATGAKITVTHFVARAAALLYRKYPEMNAKVRYWGKIELRDSIDLFLQVALDDGKDLSGVRIENADRKSAVELAQEISEKARKIRERSDPTYEKSRGLFGWLPWWLVRPILRFVDFLTNELHFHMPGMGAPRDPFGSAMITNVGMFGVDTAFAPFTPIARCPMIILVTEVRDRPWVVEKKLEVRPVLRLCATFDHRIVDGAYAGKLAREIIRLLEDPLALAENADMPTIKAPAPAAAPAKA